MQVLNRTLLDAIRKIQKITPMIHRVKLSGKYKYKNFEDKFYKIKEDYKYKENPKRVYLKKTWIRINGHQGDVYFMPEKGYYPQCFIEFSLTDVSSKEILLELNEYFENLQMSLIEYAIDFNFGYKPAKENVRFLFLLFVRYLYFQKQNNPSLFYTPRQNFTYYFSEKKNYKIYERGFDATKKAYNGMSSNDKKVEGWSYEDINRVRIEFTLDGSERLNIMGLKELDSFLKDCKFFNVYKKIINFKKFKDRTWNLPKEWKAYGTSFDGNFLDSFQKIYNHHKDKKTVENICQSVTDDKAFDNLKDTIFKKIIDFEKRWKTIR
jgi:hypothetical protein